MTPRLRGHALSLIGALLGLSCTEAETGPSPSSPGEPPNIVLILLDDADVRDFAFYEHTTPIALPTIEALARDGVVFDQFYANSPVCSPTRAAILTGQYPARYGLNHVIVRESNRGLPDRAPMLAAYLRARGYATAHVGKWHLGSATADFLPSAKGFAHTVTTGPWRGYERTTVLVDGAEQPADPDRHLTERLTDHALRFVREHRDEPFFLNLWYFTPHIPLQPPADWAAKHPATRAGRYAALMGHVDHQIGRIVNELDVLGLRDRTAILLLSDNGGTGVTHAHRSLTLRGAKNTVFEGGIRSPLILLWPGRTEQARRDASVTTTMDLFPTIVELLGGDPERHDLDGESFASALAGQRLERPGPLFWQVLASNVDVVQARSAPDYLSLFAVRDGDWKLVMNGHTLSLFDLGNDPAERTDLASEQPERTRRLLDEYDAWRLRIGRLPMTATSQNTAAPRSGDVYDLSGSGRVAFEPDLLHEVADGDLSCRLRLRTADSGRVQRILGKGDAWALVLDETGRVALRVTDQSGATHTWHGSRTLTPGTWHDLAVSFSALRSFRLSRVFVDGAVAIQGQHEHPIASSNAPIALGADDAESLSGAVEGLTCHALGLTRNDL